MQIKPAIEILIETKTVHDCTSIPFKIRLHWIPMDLDLFIKYCTQSKAVCVRDF